MRRTAISCLSIVGFRPVPRVLAKESDEQKDKAGEETGEKHQVGFKAAVLHGVECNRRESQNPKYSADNSDERRNSFLLTQCLWPR